MSHQNLHIHHKTQDLMDLVSPQKKNLETRRRKALFVITWAGMCHIQLSIIHLLFIECSVPNRSQLAFAFPRLIFTPWRWCLKVVNTKTHQAGWHRRYTRNFIRVALGLITLSVEEFFGILFDRSDTWHWKDDGFALFGLSLYSRDEQDKMDRKWTWRKTYICDLIHTQIQRNNISGWCYVHTVHAVRGVARRNLRGFFWLVHELPLAIRAPLSNDTNVLFYTACYDFQWLLRLYKICGSLS